jgi:hypothetical protein
MSSPPLEEFTMEFEPNTIEHLGLKLYSHLPPVMGEFISNAYDADSPVVEVTLPTSRIDTSSEVIIRDYGTGMDKIEIQEAYLKIGRNRREVTGKDTSESGRPLMGRKGLGKLSAFGIATEIEVRTIKNQNAICIRLNYDKMKSWNRGEPYKPDIIPELCGSTMDPQGTEIRIKKLRRKTPVEVTQLKKQIARRFTVFDEKFKVFINGSQITPADRRQKSECEYSWDVNELPEKGVIDKNKDWNVTGWIGFVQKSSQTDRGIDIFAREKSVELNTMFNYSSTHIQFARAYIIGEIKAEFLDDSEDNISTARNSVQWESESGQKLEEWGAKTLHYLFGQWRDLRAKEKEEQIIKTNEFDEWLKTRGAREQKVAQKLVKIIVHDENIEPESAGPLLDIIKTNIEFQAFLDLIDEIDESGTSIQTFLQLIGEWRVLEAREILKLSDGRREIVDQLSKFIEENALEVKQIQPLFEECGWLVNPAWINVTGQNTYTTMLRKQFPESEKTEESDKRMDILGYEAGGTLNIVELKRPKTTLSRKNLEQIEAYVDWARSAFIGTGDKSIKYISGKLIIGNLSQKSDVAEKMTRLAGDDIRVETFKDLLNRAEKIFCENEERLKSLAPEYYADKKRSIESKKAAKK